MLKWPAWYPNWDDQIIVIVASGPSAADAPIEKVRHNARVVAVNNSHELAPFAEAVFAADYRWWISYRGLTDYSGIKVMTEKYRQPPPEWEINHLAFRYVDSIIWSPPGEIGWGGGSGFQAFNWVAQLEPRMIALVGYDLTLAHGVHWHGDHDAALGLWNPNASKVARWRRAMVSAVKQVEAAGIEVINCSPYSELGCRKAQLDDVIPTRPQLELVPSSGVCRVS